MARRSVPIVKGISLVGCLPRLSAKFKASGGAAWPPFPMIAPLGKDVRLLSFLHITDGRNGKTQVTGKARR